MPELPEVETVRAGLERLLAGACIRRVTPLRADLRLPIGDLSALAGRRVLAVRRRAKYLILDTDGSGLLCHLGMTGSWRLAEAGDERPHDHCHLDLDDGRRLVFRDPRRFGVLALIPEGTSHPLLADLGIEPLDPGFDGHHLATLGHGRRTAVKAFIMDQAIVVGVGNIYAQEALFRAGIRPGLAAGRLTRARWQVLCGHIRTILAEAIAAGGSTISDFRQAGGEHGWFQHTFRVYDRGGQPCLACGGILRSGRIGGRGTTWCPRCQR